MKKRLRKKQENRYSMLKRAQREKTKRRGKKCLHYELIEIGTFDQSVLDSEGYASEYPFATHWLIKFNEIKDKFPFKNEQYDATHYFINIYLCNEHGNTTSESNFYIHPLIAQTLESSLAVYYKNLDTLKHGRFLED